MNFIHDDEGAIKALAKEQWQQIILERAEKGACKLILSYAEAINLYKLIEEADNQEILDGIITVLIARMQEYNDISDKLQFLEEELEILSSLIKILDSTLFSEESQDIFAVLYDAYQYLGLLMQIEESEVEKRVNDILELRRIESFKAVHRLKLTVGNDVAIADEMVRIFIKMLKNWPEPSDVNDNEIVRGIAETIEIKVEGLKESISQVTEDCNKIIEDYATQNSNLLADEVRAEKLKHCQISIEKILLKFKRETLLYEVSTFEEILFYSISRIREIVPIAANLADESISAIEALLKKNNIELIRPQAHEPFNSKEHEVLMAEQNPDYNKGEVIKMMNSGYKHNGVVLLRANVIAAR